MSLLPSEGYPPSLCFSFEGCGNAISIVDLRSSPYSFTAEDVKLLHAHIPFDQLILIHHARSNGADVFLRIYNADGSESGMCGNGLRCLGSFLMPKKTYGPLTFETIAGLFICERLDGDQFCVDMGRPQFLWEEIPLAHAVPDPQAISFPEYGLQEGQNVHLDSGFAVNMGNPHIVFFVKPISNSAFQSLGPILENHELFPERVNVSFCTVENTSHLHLRVWERGAGPTKACGSGACAAAIAAISKGLADRSVKVTQQGGDLVIHWRMSDNHVLMNGPVIYCSMQPIPQAIGTKL